MTFFFKNNFFEADLAVRLQSSYFSNFTEPSARVERHGKNDKWLGS